MSEQLKDDDIETKAVLLERDKELIAKAIAIYDDISERGFAVEVAATLTSSILMVEAIGGITYQLDDMRQAQAVNMVLEAVNAMKRADHRKWRGKNNGGLRDE